MSYLQHVVFVKVSDFSFGVERCPPPPIRITPTISQWLQTIWVLSATFLDPCTQAPFLHLLLAVLQTPLKKLLRKFMDI